jgi:mRNA interferase MazF
MLSKIKRGEMYYADLDPAIGSEQSGIRPVVIVSNDVGNRHSPTIIVAAITSQPKKKKLPTHCPLPAENGLEHPSQVLLEQVRTLDKSRLQDYIGTLEESDMKGIGRALAVSMGLTDMKNTDGSGFNTLLLTLCDACVRQFFDSPGHIVRRANQNQRFKEPCMYCSDKSGWNYEITRRGDK